MLHVVERSLFTDRPTSARLYQAHERTLIKTASHLTSATRKNGCDQAIVKHLTLYTSMLNRPLRI